MLCPKSAMSEVQILRDKEKFKAGGFMKLNFNEKVAARSNNKIGAIKEYHERTGVSLRLSKMIVDSFVDEAINAGHRKQNP